MRVERGGTRVEIKRLLDIYVSMCCKRIVALRGDMPSGMFSSSDFRYAARGITVPIVPGIMAIGNFSQLKRFSDMCGTEIRRWLAKRMLGFGDDAQSIRDYRADVVAELCDQLVSGGVEALHFYTLNRAKSTLDVLERLGVKPKILL